MSTGTMMAGSFGHGKSFVVNINIGVIIVVVVVVVVIKTPTFKRSTSKNVHWFLDGWYFGDVK